MIRKVTVNLKDRLYYVYIGSGVIYKLGSLLQEHTGNRRIVLVTNTTVDELYGDFVKNILEKAEFCVSKVVIPDGEEYKTLEYASYLYDEFLMAKVDKTTTIVSLGGGVIGDLTGFAASTFMRGVPFVQIPTTLLAQVDASVGGKVAVNHPSCKNLIGSFYQPRFVLAELDFLKTLPKCELVAGMAEIIKHGVIADRELCVFLEKHSADMLSLESSTVLHVIEKSCTIKARIVERDEKECKLRGILNYGHTVGHAVEALTSYKVYKHGEAVAIGMHQAAKLSYTLGLCDRDFVERQRDLIASIGLPCSYNNSIKPEDIVKVLPLDKKVQNSQVVFVLVHGIEKPVFKQDISTDIILTALQTEPTFVGK